MKLVCPTFQRGHTYQEYDEKLKEIKEAFSDKDIVCIDLDFLHKNEVEKYFMEFVFGRFNKSFFIRSKRIDRIKECILLFYSRMIFYSEISISGDFIYVKVLSNEDSEEAKNETKIRRKPR